MPYLLFADALVRVVQLVREDLSIASEGFVPAERNGGRRVGHPLQVRSRAGYLDWWRNITGGQKLEKQQVWPFCSPILNRSSFLLCLIWEKETNLAIPSSLRHILGYLTVTFPSANTDAKLSPSGLGCQHADFLPIPRTKAEVSTKTSVRI